MLGYIKSKSIARSLQFAIAAVMFLVCMIAKNLPVVRQSVFDVSGFVLCLGGHVQSNKLARLNQLAR